MAPGRTLLIGWKAAVNDRTIASLRYRVETPVRALQALGHAVEVFDAERETDYDVVIFAKTYSLSDRALAGRVRARGGRVVFDLCDNHFYNPKNVPKYRQVREELLDMLSLAQQVVCTTPALAQVVRQEAPWAAEPIVIGDAVEHVEPATPSLEPFAGTRLLWFGSQGSPNAPAGIADILLVKDHLIQASRNAPVELVVCSNNLEKYRELIEPLPLRTRYEPWSLAGFNGILASVDAAIIPISLNPFTGCKTHNRLTTALDAAVPVIADSIESYREFAPFCTLDDWQGGLQRLIQAPQAERAKAAAGRDYLRQHWNASAMALKWQQALGLAPESAATDAQVATSSPGPAGGPASTGRLAGRGLACQGALDRRAKDAITGWVRAPAAPGTKLVVRLVGGGQQLACCLADQPREDLAAAGFSDAACGFALPLPSGDPGVLEVEVEGADFRFPESGFNLATDGGHGLRIVADPGFASAPAKTFSHGLLPPSSARADAAAALQVQSELLEQLSSLGELMNSAREAAARLVIAAGDDAALGRRLLGLFTRGLKPELRRVLDWSESGEGPAPPLN